MTDQQQKWMKSHLVSDKYSNDNGPALDEAQEKQMRMSTIEIIRAKLIRAEQGEICKRTVEEILAKSKEDLL